MLKIKVKKFFRIIFIIVTRNYFDKIEYTWKCKYFWRNKDKAENGNKFCSAIKGLKTDVINDIITFYLKQEHSDIYNKINNNRTNKSDNKDKLVDKPGNKEKEDINKINNLKSDLKQKIENCKNAEEINNIILEECKLNKHHLINKNTFEKYFKNLYESKKIKI